MSARSVLCLVGTRPEAIGMTPIVHAPRHRTERPPRPNSAIRFPGIGTDQWGADAMSLPALSLLAPHGQLAP